MYQQRADCISDLLDQQAGVVSRAQLRGRGIDRHAVRAEAAAGRWETWGRHTVAVSVTDLPAAMRWSAIFEVGKHARLDGATALVASGLTGWQCDAVELAVPHGMSAKGHPGIRICRVRGLEQPQPVGIPRSPVVPATVRAALRARSRPQAATLLAMVVQQRLVDASRLLMAWNEVRWAPDHRFITTIVEDVCDGAHALGELDFARLCRTYGLPEPEHQAVLQGPRGRIYRDIRWPGLTVEIDGAQHFAGLAVVEDALRANAVTMTGDMVLRIPVLGLRLREADFMRQVVAPRATLRTGGSRGRPCP